MSARAVIEAVLDSTSVPSLRPARMFSILQFRRKAAAAQGRRLGTVGFGVVLRDVL